MIRDRQNLEAQREKDRMIAWEKRYSLALGKVAKQTKAHRKLKMTKVMNSIKRWEVVLKELLKKTPMYVEE